MAKKIDAYIKLQVPAGSANPKSSCWSCIRPARGKHYGVL